MKPRPSPKTPYKLVNQVIDSLHVRLSKNAQPSDWLQDLKAKVKAYRLKLEQDPTLEPLTIKHPELGSFTVFTKVSGGHYDFSLYNPTLADIRVWNPDKWQSKALTKLAQRALYAPNANPNQF